MKKILSVLLALAAVLSLRAQEPYPELGARLEQYFTALAGEPAAVQNQECDFLIASCEDSLVRQYVALKIYDHYLQSKIMGDDAVAVHVADTWFLSGAVAMHTDMDLVHAQLFADFNRASLIGQPAPEIRLFTPEGEQTRVPGEGYSVLYFYDIACATCKVETQRLKKFLREEEYPFTIYAIYTGADADAWEEARKDFRGAVHLWDPEISSDWQRLYGVLQTPRMFLVSPDGKIAGRGLDTPALKILLHRALGTGKYTYGEESRMESYRQLFAPYGEQVTVQDIMEVADYLALRTAGEGNQIAFKQIFGDFLYYLSSRKTEAYRDAAIPFTEKYIRGLPEMWDSPDDHAQVVSLGEMMAELAARTPVGSQIPDLKVRGELRQRPCLFRPRSRSGLFSLRSLKGKPAYVAFYTGGCSACRDLIEQADRVLAGQRGAKVLLVDMDSLIVEHEEEAVVLLDTFDLSGLPFIIELDARGTILHKYVDFKTSSGNLFNE